MKYNVNKIEINNKGVPLHVHSVHEIIFYYEGEGNITVSGKEYRVKRGDIVIIPSGTYHCTLPTDMLKAIYLNGELSQLFNISSPLFIKDNQAEEGYKLIQIIYDNRFGNKEYLTVLINAYLQYILQSVTFENDLNLAVKNIIKSITERCFEADLSISKILKESGYSEDYVRASFKKIVGKTPYEFLTELRINNAVRLIELYKSVIGLGEIAEACGYDDYVYFSKIFKKVVGKSPRQFRNEL